MSSPAAFHHFPQLPSELRLKIWHHALLAPRVVTVSCERELLNRSRRFAKSFASSTAPPALLHACRESRFEALAAYAPSFRTATAPNYTYVCFARDTVRCAASVLQYMGDDEVASVQRLVLDVSDAAYFGHFYMEILERMRALRELDLLTDDGALHYRRYIDALTQDFKEARHRDPGWECPRVRMLDRNTGHELRVIEGGAVLPGWKKGDEYPEDLLL